MMPTHEYVWLYLKTYYFFEVVVIGLALLVFLVGWLRYRKQRVGGRLPAQAVYQLGGYYYKERSLKRSITSTFIHTSWDHLYGNLFEYVLYSYILENISYLSSGWRLVIFIASSGLATILSGLRFKRDVITAGMSGGVMGLQGATLFYLFYSKPHQLTTNRTFFVVLCLTTLNSLIQQLISNKRDGGRINVQSHILGLVLGFGMAFLLRMLTN